MINIIKLAHDKNIGIQIIPYDGAFRPLIGKLMSVVTLSNESGYISINITEFMTDADIELAIDDAIRKLTYGAKA